MKYYNKPIVAKYHRHLDNEDFSVYVLDDNDYFNIHIISERFANEEMNTLKLQEPKDCITAEYFTDARLITYLLDHFIWDRFYSDLQLNDLIVYTTLETI